MSKPKIIISLLIKSMLFLSVLTAAMIIITPFLIDMEMVKKKIETTVSKEIGGEIKYRHLDLSYFPRPHVVVHQVQIRIPASFQIKMNRMKIYLKIAPLFLGSLQAGNVVLEYADYFMRLPQISREGPFSEKHASFGDIAEAISKAIRGLPEFKLPELKLRINFGNINLVDPFGRKFKIREVQAIYQRRPNNLNFSIRCKSNLWDSIDVNGSLNPLNFRGKGHIRLSQFRPQVLMAYLFHNSALQVTDTKANLAIDVALDGIGNIKATVDGAIPLLSLKHREEQLTIKGGRVQGTVHIAGRTIGISLTDVGLDYPKLEATGIFSYDENLQDIHLTINASRIDAASVRQVALGFAGESKTVQTIFDIVRGGYVPWMTVRIRGRRIADLGMLDNIVIKGRMTQGKIFIPGAELNLENVVGDALISEGILHGENLEAAMGNSGGRAGEMTLGLNENIAPFHLKIGVNADLSQLPPVLNRVVRNQGFLNELSLIKDVKGTATGILILGDDLASLKAEVQASNIHLAARYKRLPYEVEIDGGQFNYSGRRLAFDNFNVNIGRSSFLNPSIAVDWTATPRLSVNSQSAKINLDELYTGLLSFEVFKTNLNFISGLKGEITANDLIIEGPFFRPNDWQFQTRGTMNKVYLTSKTLPKSLRLSRGHFNWQGKKIAFNDVEAATGKSSIQGIYGEVNWTRAPVFSTRSGPVLLHFEDIAPLILSNKRFSTALERFKPLNGSLSFERMKVRGPVSNTSFEQVSISADVKQLTFQTKGFPGPLRIADGTVTWRKNRFTIKEFNVSLGNSTMSQFSAGFDLGKSSRLEMSSQSVNLFVDEFFPWLLSFKNIETYFKDVYPNKGWIFLSNLKMKGPLHVPDQWHFTVAGNMKNLVLTSDAFGDPVTIDNGSFELTSETKAEVVQNRVWINETSLTWGGNHLILIGSLVLSKNETLLDLTLTADAMDWNQVNHLVEFAGKKSNEPGSRLRTRDLLGTLRFQTENFDYETFSVNSLKAAFTFRPDKVVAAINEATVCGVSFQGQVAYDAQTLQIDLIPIAENQLLGPAVSCITDQENWATGTFNLDGRILSKSKPDKFLRSLSGEIIFAAERGRIFRFGLLAKILSILNVTEIYRGQLPDLTGKGFAYHGMTISANIEDGKLSMQECSLDGVSMGVACEGEIDLSENKMDLIILVAPFKTIDRIVKFLPVIKHILGGKLISIPFRAKGDLSDPEVIPLHPTAVGSEMLGILERTLKLPITILQPIFSSGNQIKSDREADDTQGPTGDP